MSKQLIFGQEARAKLVAGANKIGNATKVTLGPCGRNVVLKDSSTLETVVTKDGVTVNKGALPLEDPFENMGAEFMVEASSKSNDMVGDGTTTSTVLACEIVNEGTKYVSSGANPIFIKRGMDKATQLIVDEIKKVSKTVEGEDIKNVAAISANNDYEMGSLVAEAIEKVGKDGVITVEESKTLNTTVKVTEGMQINEGYNGTSPYFATDSKIIEYSDPFILLYDKSISSMKEILPILEKVAQQGKPLVIISDGIEGEALTTLVINNIRGALKACAVKAPGYGTKKTATLEDIAVLTKGTVITENVGLKLETVTLDMLGRAKSVKISKDTTTIVDGYGTKEDVNARIDEIKALINDNKDNTSPLAGHDEDLLKERLAKLSGGVAVIEIGAATESEMREKRYRIDDTLAATRAAIEEGIVAGGGTTLISIAERVLTKEVIESVQDEDEKLGFKIIKHAVEKPLWQIAENAGVSGDVVVQNVKNYINSNEDIDGYNAKTNQYVNMINNGIIDPAKVTRCALQNATSSAGTLLTAECAITDKPEQKQQNSCANNMVM